MIPNIKFISRLEIHILRLKIHILRLRINFQTGYKQKQDEYKETASSADIIGYKTKYECPPAGDAKQYAYGAGGGGGYAHSEPDCMSEGGKGASGAIIIEW